MREQHLGYVRRQVCDAVTGLNAFTQDAGQSRDLVTELSVRVGPVAVNDGGALGEHRGAALEKAQRTERGVVGCDSCRDRHGSSEGDVARLVSR